MTKRTIYSKYLQDWHEINAKKNILKAAKEIICNLGLY